MQAVLWPLLLQVILIALNAVFACAEIAVISVNDNKLAQLVAQGDKRALRLARLTSRPAQFLATIQIAITLSGFLGSAFAADHFSDRLVALLLRAGVPIPEKTLDTLSVILITLLLSFFPGLFGDWELNIDPVAIHIGHGIYWYGIILAFAMLAGLYLCMKQAKHYGLTEDNIMDMVLWAVPCCIIGARFYYVLFYLDLYRNTDGSLDWGAMFRIWDGGLAIYGAVIAGVLVALVYTKRHKLPFFAMGDVAVMGLLLGQIIGRWANFINREAFGGETTLPWRMKLWVSQYTSIEVHPTFFYESFWNLIGLLLILFIVSKGRRFDGENTWFYFLWYGLGRSWIEGLRTDSLYLFNWELFGQRIRVSQALSIVMVAVAAFMLFYNIRIKKRSPESLWVHQVAAEKARLAAAEAEDAVLAETLMNEVPTEGEAADPLETEAVETPDAETVPDTETQEKPEKGETHGNEN